MASSESVHITDLFQKDNRGGYRIPALLHIPNSNTLLAFAERRLGCYDEDADVFYLRSGTYNKSLKNFQWEDAKPIQSAKLEQHRSMNPCPVYEKNTDTIFLFFIAVEGSKTEQEQISSGKNAARLCYVTSMDKGQTWSETNDLTECTIGHTINTWATFAVGPGHGIQLRNGRLVIPASAHEIQSNNQVRVRAFTFFRDFQGVSWQLGNFVSGEECGECQVVSVGQGNASSEQTLVYCNARSNKQKYRVEAFSEDGGKTFTKGQLIKQLVEPPGGCHGSIISFPASDISQVKNYLDVKLYHSQKGVDASDFDIILFSHTTNCALRKDLGIYLNTYSGSLQTWTNPWVIVHGECAYSELALVKLPEERNPMVTCLFELGAINDKISFCVLQIDDIIENTVNSVCLRLPACGSACCRSACCRSTCCGSTCCGSTCCRSACCRSACCGSACYRSPCCGSACCTPTCGIV